MFCRGNLDGSQPKESRKKEGGMNGEGTKDVKDEEGENPGAAVLTLWWRTLRLTQTWAIP